MQVVFHFGAYATDAERLIATLAANPGVLDQRGICVPAPVLYRTQIRDALVAQTAGPVLEDPAAQILDACTEGKAVAVERLILSHGNFIGMPDRLITAGGLYPVAGQKMPPLASLFPEAGIEYHMALINPAVLIGVLAGRQLQRRSMEEILGGRDAEDIRWVPTIRRMVEAAEGDPLVLWCNEDMPLIQPEVVRSLGAIPGDVPLEQEDSILDQVMSADGALRLRNYLREFPPRSVTQRRGIVSAFMERFVRPAAVEVAINLPGWNSELIETITEIYEAEVAEIAAMPGVTFLSA